MEQKTLKIDDLNPDGLRITVNWEDMSVSASIFVPLHQHRKRYRTT